MKLVTPRTTLLALGLALAGAAPALLAQTATAPASAAGQPGQARQHPKLDANGDGVIDRAEAAKAPRLSQNFDKLDANHDGKLGADERPQRGQGEGRPGGRGDRGDRGARMAQMDKNGDGKFSRDELAGHQRALEHFGDIDANKDGFLTREEMMAYHKAHRGERGPRGPQAAPQPAPRP